MSETLNVRLGSFLDLPLRTPPVPWNGPLCIQVALIEVADIRPHHAPHSSSPFGRPLPSGLSPLTWRGHFCQIAC